MSRRICWARGLWPHNALLQWRALRSVLLLFGSAASPPLPQLDAGQYASMIVKSVSVPLRASQPVARMDHGPCGVDACQRRKHPHSKAPCAVPCCAYGTSRKLPNLFQQQRHKCKAANTIQPAPFRVWALSVRPHPLPPPHHGIYYNLRNMWNTFRIFGTFAMRIKRIMDYIPQYYEILHASSQF